MLNWPRQPSHQCEIHIKKHFGLLNNASRYERTTIDCAKTDSNNAQQLNTRTHTHCWCFFVLFDNSGIRIIPFRAIYAARMIKSALFSIHICGCMSVGWLIATPDSLLFYWIFRLYLYDSYEDYGFAFDFHLDLHPVRKRLFFALKAKNFTRQNERQHRQNTQHRYAYTEDKIFTLSP